MPRWNSARASREAAVIARALHETMRERWRRTCVGAQVGQVVNTVTGPTDVLPTIVAVTGSDIFRVQLPHGMVVQDLRDEAHRLAAGMGAAMLRATDVAGHPLLADIALLAADPLTTATIPLPRPVSSVHDRLSLGVAEDGLTVPLHLPSSAHLITQGASGSGKSVGQYGFLGQLVSAPDVIVGGSDVTSLLLGPWARSPRSAPWIACGTADLQAHVRLLEQAVREMDRRIDSLPFGADQVTVTDDLPLILFVVEEYPGLLRLLAGQPTVKGVSSLLDRAKTAVGRLLSESRKAGMRVQLIAQRADASVIGGYERGQASHTVSYRVDNLAALGMLHADVSSDDARAHASALPGVALLSAPGVPLLRLRAPRTDYAAYCALVAGPGAVAA